MKYVFESLEDTFPFGKFNGFSLKEVYTGNNALEPNLLFAYLKDLVETDDASFMLPKHILLTLQVLELDEAVIKFGCSEVHPKLAEHAVFKNLESSHAMQAIYNLIFNQIDNNYITLYNGNFGIVDFALKNYDDLEKLPGESASAIAWYIKNVKGFCIKPEVLSSLFSFHVHELLGVKLRRIRNLEFSYKAFFNREHRSFSKDIIDLNTSKYAARHNQNDTKRCNEDISTYQRYQGSYASDEMGFSDQDIDDVFDGNPDAYWNID